MELKNKVAIITGASSGIGRAVTQNLNQAGLKFVLTGRRVDRLKELKNELDFAEIIAGDITNPDLPDKLIKTASENFGRCDIVFNNAGVINMGTIEEISVEDICYMVRVNVEVAYRMAYVAL